MPSPRMVGSRKKSTGSTTLSETRWCVSFREVACSGELIRLQQARSIMQLRFANELLIDSLFNKDKVSAVLIELKETFGCEGRGGYFDEFGIIRDVLQNRKLPWCFLYRSSHTILIHYSSSRLYAAIDVLGHGQAQLTRRGLHSRRKGRRIAFAV